MEITSLLRKEFENLRCPQSHSHLGFGDQRRNEVGEKRGLRRIGAQGVRNWEKIKPARRYMSRNYGGVWLIAMWLNTFILSILVGQQKNSRIRWIKQS